VFGEITPLAWNLCLSLHSLRFNNLGVKTRTPLVLRHEERCQNAKGRKTKKLIPNLKNSFISEQGVGSGEFS
jgi:hypothetical protein